MAETSTRDYDHHRGSAPLLRPTSWWRLGGFMLLNVVGFLAVNAFWQYLFRGEWLDFSAQAYRHDLVTPLGAVLVSPLSIFTHPWMILVTGLLLATVIFVPILVAVLYRAGFAAIFVVIVIAVGHAPLLGLTLALGCALAARTRLRSDMPFVAVLLGLAPLAAYLGLSAYAGVDAAIVPLQRWLLLVPFLVALVAAIIAATLVLSLARLTRFRPGVVWPVLTVMLAAPTAVFYTRVGPRELAYARITTLKLSELLDGAGEFRSPLSANDAIFPAVAREEWARQVGALGVTEPQLLDHARDLLTKRKGQLIEQCERFLRRYPPGPRSAEVAWIRAQCLSLQLDRRAFDEGLIRYSARYALPTSRPAWEALTKDFPGTPQAAFAEFRIAEFLVRSLARPREKLTDEERSRRITLADEALEKSESRLTSYANETPRPGGYTRAGEVFEEPPAVPLRDYAAEVRLAAARLLWLIRENQAADDPATATVLAEYLQANPLADNYYGQLLAIMQDPSLQAEKTRMEDNLRLALAMTAPSERDRVEALIALSRELNDAAIEANYELGRLVLQKPQLRKRPDVSPAETYFKRVTGAPVSPFIEPAADRLKWLGTRPAR